MEARLLRSIQTGTLQELTVDQVLRYTRDPARAGYLGFALASAALHANGAHHLPADWPAERMLDKTLRELHPGLAFGTPPDFPARFGNEDLVFTLVYAMAIGGATERVTTILEQHLDGAPDYKRGVILQSLRNLGTQRASGLIQKAAAHGGDRGLAENLLVDLHYPFLDDLHNRLALIPPGGRNRRNLVRLAQTGCGIKPALAAYFLGFQPRSGEAGEERGELELLRRLATLDCHWTRFIAIRSLALRSAEPIAFWERLYQDEKDGWQKAQLVRIGFARFGRAFAPVALTWLARESVQYVQWELMHGYLEAARGVVLRDYWDIWLPATLQFRLNFPPRNETAAEADSGEALAWFEAGNRPLDDVVRNHFLYGLAKTAAGDGTRRLLRILSGIPERGRLWWVLQPLQDQAALPLLRYWQSFETDPEQHRMAENVVLALQNRRRSSGSAYACCQPTRACLAQRVQAGGGSAGAVITTEEQARSWLSGQTAVPIDPGIRFLDPLERVADVSLSATRVQRWEHLYGCWRMTGTTAKPD